LPSIPGYPFTPAACPHDKTLALADVETRLKALDEHTEERLINWGYASVKWTSLGGQVSG